MKKYKINTYQPGFDAEQVQIGIKVALDWVWQCASLTHLAFSIGQGQALPLRIMINLGVQPTPDASPFLPCGDALPHEGKQAGAGRPYCSTYECTKSILCGSAS